VRSGKKVGALLRQCALASRGKSLSVVVNKALECAVTRGVLVGVESTQKGFRNLDQQLHANAFKCGCVGCPSAMPSLAQGGGQQQDRCGCSGDTQQSSTSDLFLSLVALAVLQNDS